VEFGLSIAVKVDAFNSLPDHLKRELGGDPHYLAFKCVVLAMMTRMTTIEPGSTINFTCDEDENTTRHCFEWYKQIKREREDVRSKLVSFCIADDTHFPQLQAADLFAAINRAEAEAHFFGRDYAFRELFTELTKQDEHGRLAYGTTFFDENDLRPMVEQWEEAVKQLAHPPPHDS
jgi:hypothetical protein